MDAQYINLLIEAFESVFREMTQIELKMSSKAMRLNARYEKNVAVAIGLTGQIKGTVMLSMDQVYANKVASSVMYGMLVDSFDELAQSAIREVMNMVMGKAAAWIEEKGKMIDITPPMLMMGNKYSLSDRQLPALKLGFSDERNEEVVYLDIAISEK